MKAQGATEYLVLLAVVLIVALVSVALLGFFPGMASDAQETQSKTYWQSASPISIVEWGALTDGVGYTMPYLRVKNSGAYPIRITKMVSSTNYASQMEVSSGSTVMSDVYYLTPGEEKFFGWAPSFYTLPYHSGVYFYSSYATNGTRNLGGATSLCVPNAPRAGTLVVPGFGFEYIEYIDNQQITKREIGAKPLSIKCRQYP